MPKTLPGIQASPSSSPIVVKITRGASRGIKAWLKIASPVVSSSLVPGMRLSPRHARRLASVLEPGALKPPLQGLQTGLLGWKGLLSFQQDGQRPGNQGDERSEPHLSLAARGLAAPCVFLSGLRAALLALVPRKAVFRGSRVPGKLCYP